MQRPGQKAERGHTPVSCEGRREAAGGRRTLNSLLEEEREGEPGVIKNFGKFTVTGEPGRGVKQRELINSTAGHGMDKFLNTVRGGCQYRV